MASVLCLVVEAQAQTVSCGPADSPGARAAQAMVDASVRAQQRDFEVFEAVSRETTQRINSATSCLNQVTQAINQQIPSFGGGLLGSISSSITQNLANQACSVAGQAQRQFQQELNNLPSMTQPIVGSIPIGSPSFNPASGNTNTGGIARPANEGGGVIQSVGSLLSRLF